MIHQCPIGKSFSDEKHQCITRFKEINNYISNAKVTKLTQKIILLEHLIESFQDKITKVQHVIIDTDNKIGLLGRVLLKALKNNQMCTNSERPNSVPVVATELTPLQTVLNNEEIVDQNNVSLNSEQKVYEPIMISVPANSSKTNENVFEEEQPPLKQANKEDVEDNHKFVTLASGIDINNSAIDGQTIEQQDQKQSEN